MPRLLIALLTVVLLLVLVGAIFTIARETGYKLRSPVVADDRYNDPTGPAATEEEDDAASVAAGQAECDKFGQGEFVGWINRKALQARCRRVPVQRLATPTPYAPPPAPVQEEVRPTGPERCNEIRPGSTFIKWIDEERGVARCTPPRK